MEHDQEDQAESLRTLTEHSVDAMKYMFVHPVIAKQIDPLGGWFPARETRERFQIHQRNTKKGFGYE